MKANLKPCAQDPRYKCSSNGDIFGLSGSVMKPQKSGYGYCAVKIAGKSTLVHRIIAETFLPNPSSHRAVEHINGDKWDNRVENLKWGPVKHDKYSKRGMALKLTNAESEEIMYVSSTRSAARFLGCTPPGVGYWVRVNSPGPCRGWLVERIELDHQIFYDLKSDTLTEEQFTNYNAN